MDDKPNRTLTEAVALISQAVQRRFPKTFNSENPLPLQMGIERSLMAYYKRRFTFPEMVAFLKQWTSRDEYMRAMAESAHRYNAEGVRVGFISKKQQDFHKNMWNKIQSKREK